MKNTTLIVIDTIRRYEPSMSCEDCDPKGLVTIPNVALLSSVGLLESYPILNTSIPVLGRPLEIILELLNNGISDGEFKVDLWYTK